MCLLRVSLHVVLCMCVLCLYRHFSDSHHRPSYPSHPSLRKQTSGCPPSVHAAVRMLVCVREQRWVCFPHLLRKCKCWSLFYSVCLCYSIVEQQDRLRKIEMGRNKYPLFVSHFLAHVFCQMLKMLSLVYRGTSRAWEVIEELGWIRGLPKQCESGFML